MPLAATPQEQLDAVQEVLREQAIQHEPTIANVELATTEHDTGFFIFRGRPFRVPPVPYKQAMWILALDQELRRITRLENTTENLATTIKLLVELVEIFRQLVRPVRLWDRLFWRLMGNPFANADVGEINWMRNFFCDGRMKFPVRAIAAEKAPRWLRRTWPTTKPYLLVGIQHGRRKTVSHVATDTI